MDLLIDEIIPFTVSQDTHYCLATTKTNLK
jgi:hypothetical protein